VLISRIPCGLLEKMRGVSVRSTMAHASLTGTLQCRQATLPHGRRGSWGRSVQATLLRTGEPIVHAGWARPQGNQRLRWRLCVVEQLLCTGALLGGMPGEQCAIGPRSFGVLLIGCVPVCYVRGCDETTRQGSAMRRPGLDLMSPEHVGPPTPSFFTKIF
jgi:hypothetical protein